MSRYHSYIASATAILDAYKGDEPFVHFTRKQFAANKKFGSRDRKIISGLCYGYFRTKHAQVGTSTSDNILVGVFLQESVFNPLLELLRPEWNEKISWPVKEKLKLLSIPASSLFPFSAQLSDQLDQEAYSLSFLTQPLLYIRIRPGRSVKVISALETAGIQYQLHREDCLALSNATALDKVISLNRDAVVQDYNSQNVFDNGIAYILPGTSKKINAWDCCAASGGKSILLYDRLNGNLNLTVSDIRSNIIANLKTRLQEARVPIQKTFIADLTRHLPDEISEDFPLIICDAPCTGSGTWARTPEQLAFFREELVDSYAEKQKQIASNAFQKLVMGGLFFYITCSVFKKENEAVVAYLKDAFAVEVLNMQYLEGYRMQADSMFVAVLKKISEE